MARSRFRRQRADAVVVRYRISVGGWRQGGNLLLAQQRFHRVGQRIVPVLVETGRHGAYLPAGGYHVEVDEIAAIPLAEIDIAQIAAAGDAEGIVGQEQLVVHAVLHALEIVQRTEDAQKAVAARAADRVEQADFHAGHEDQLQHPGIRALGVEVVQQDAHPHAAFGRIAYSRQQFARRGIGMDGVILQVQRAFGLPGQRKPGGKGGIGTAEQAEAGVLSATGLLAQLAGEPSQRGGLADRQGMGGRLLVIGRQRATTAQCQQQAEQQRQQPARLA